MAAGERYRWITLGLLIGAQFVVVLDAAIVTVALPSIATDLRFAEQDLSWIVNAYLLTFGGFLLLGGRLADLIGRRCIFVTGLVVFGLASLADGLAGTPGQLVAARAVQGLCAALLSPAALSILTATFQSGPQRDRALGAWAAAGASGGAGGVLLGGVLTGSVGWRWVFWVNVPVAITAAALTLCFVAEHRAPQTSGHIDLAGGVSITAGLSLLVYALVSAPEHGWASAPTLACLGGAATLIVTFIVIELHTRSPLVPFSVFRRRPLTGANLTMLIFFPGMAGMFYFVSLYLQQILGYQPLIAGLAQLPLALGIIVSSRVASWLATRHGVRPVLLSGLVLFTGGLVWFAQVSPSGGFVIDVLGPSLLAALGVGMVFVTLTILAMGDTGEAEAGLTSGLINTSQQLGAALGLAVLASVAGFRTQHALTAAHSTPSAAIIALTAGYQSAFLGGAGFVLTAMVVAVLFTRPSSTQYNRSRVPDPDRKQVVSRQP
ncbi:MAG: MFS transporter [Pseudonocardia sp.]|nr:MFS transporter [Pseudonocardia sp.]